MTVSIILINYFCETLISNCIESIRRFENQFNYEIIVVNNGGDSLMLSTIEQKFNFQLIESGGNIGFSRANNLGLKHAKGEYILFLNADTVFIEPILPALIEQLNQDLSVGLIACQLVNLDLSLQLSYHDGDAVFQKLKRRNPMAIKFFNSTQKLNKAQQKVLELHSKKHDAPWLSGACMLLRKSDIQKYKWYWDEDFFMYWEDVELCYRIRKMGFRVCYFPVVKLIHIGGSGEANVSLSRFNWMENAKLLFIQKTKGNIYKWIYWIWMKWELRLESFLERKKHKPFQNTILVKEIDFYLKQKK